MATLLTKLLDDFFQDLRFTVRQLRQSPLFAATIIATFAVGIAANAAVFSVMDAIVLRPLAIPDLQRIVTVAEQRDAEYARAVTFADYEDYRRQSHAFSQLAARTQTYLTLSRSGQSEHVQATRASSNLFELFGVQPLLGRTFAVGEDQPGRDGEAVLTHAFWQSHFGGRPDVLSETLVLDGRSYTIIGVMPQSFDHVSFTDLWLPLAPTPQQRNDRTRRDYTVTGKLLRGVTVSAASEELNAIAADISRKYPDTNKGSGVRVRPLVESINGELTPTFTRIILAATVLLMLVVCANVSNLQFSRTLRRAPEMAVRSALGSSRGRLIRQLLVESLAQSLLGAVGGLLLARVALHYILVAMPQQVSRFLAGWSYIHLSGHALAYSIAVAVAAGLLAGVAPALAGMRVNILEQLKAGSRSLSGSARSHRLRSVFAGAQVMLATALVAGAALIASSMYTMLHATARFAPQQMLTFNAYLPMSHYPSPVRQASFLGDSLSRLRTVPGVRSAEFTTALPYNNTGVWWQELAIVGDPALPGQSRTTQRLTTSPGLLNSLGIPLLRGRYLSSTDGMDTPPVAVISARLARRYFGDKDPIGHLIQLGKAGDADSTGPVTIVGVVGDLVYVWVDQTPQPAVYLSSSQFPSSSGTYMLRTDGDPKALAPAARQALASIDSTVPLDAVETYDQFLHESLIGLWYIVAMLTADACIALLLCALGIFGVMANLVTERTHEIGIRIAVGADRSALMRLMLRRSLAVTAFGLAAGMLLAAQAGRLLASLLEGIHAFQMVILVATAITVALISLFAGYVPARRAAAISPTQALRAE
jgi:putative ABC transport system permease protein